jgi:hypothetical protein
VTQSTEPSPYFIWFNGKRESSFPMHSNCQPQQSVKTLPHLNAKLQTSAVCFGESAASAKSIRMFSMTYCKVAALSCKHHMCRKLKVKLLQHFSDLTFHPHNSIRQSCGMCPHDCFNEDHTLNKSFCQQQLPFAIDSSPAYVSNSGIFGWRWHL